MVVSTMAFEEIELSTLSIPNARPSREEIIEVILPEKENGKSLSEEARGKDSVPPDLRWEGEAHWP